MAGAGAERVIDGDDAESADGVAAGHRQVEFGDLLFERAAVQGDAEVGLLELAGFLAKAGGAGVLALVVAVDAVVGFVEGAGEIGTRVREAEAFAVAPFVFGENEPGGVVFGDRLDGYELFELEFVRLFEENAGLVLFLAGLGVVGPGGVFGGDVQVVGVAGGVIEPLGDGAGVGKFRERFAHVGFQFDLEGVAVEMLGVGFLDRRQGLALDEGALDGIERGEFGVLILEGADLLLNLEEFAEEVLQMGREGEDQFRLGLAGEGFGIHARRQELGQERRVASFKKPLEGYVDLGQALRRIEVFKMQAKGERKIIARLHWGCRDGWRRMPHQPTILPRSRQR